MKREARAAAAPRRRPVQARSEARVAAIVQAAAELFDAEGFDGTTTAAVARRAGVPIGTLYQFFADKSELLDAVGARLHARMTEAAHALFRDDLLVRGSLEAVVTHLVDVVLRDLEREPGFAELSAMVGRGGRLAEKHASHHQVLTELVAAALAVRAPALRPDEREVVAHTAVWLTNLAHLPGVARDERGRELQRRECKRVLVRYLGPYLDV